MIVYGVDTVGGMTKSITVGQLRQNPTEALNEVAAGATYEVTKHRQVIARLTPPAQADTDVDDRRGRGASLSQARDSALYRNQDPDLTERMLDELEAGRDAMGSLG